MINSSIIIKSYTENRVKEIVEKFLWWEKLNYQWEKYETCFLNDEECEKYVFEKLVLPSLDVEKCLSKLQDDQEYELHHNNLYQKNLITKKIRYFKSLRKLKDNTELYNTISKINWFIIGIQDNKEWNDFVSLLTGEKIIHDVINTRPEKGYKPYKISSKIIFNRNG